MSVSALAQSTAGPPRAAPTPVEAGVADVGALSTSLRQLRADLRAPSRFDRVYRLPAPADGSPNAGKLVRFDSGVAAVFPRSEYTMGRWGPRATIPAGTTFYIGKLPDSLVQAAASGAAAAPSGLRVDRAVRLGASNAAGGGRAAKQPVTRVDLRARPAEDFEHATADERARVSGDASGERPAASARQVSQAVGSGSGTGQSIMDSETARLAWIDGLARRD